MHWTMKEWITSQLLIIPEPKVEINVSLTAFSLTNMLAMDFHTTPKKSLNHFETEILP